MKVSNVIFVCVQNAGRSQMAEALMRRAAGDKVRTSSAGSAPAKAVHPSVIATMREIDIDLTAVVPRALVDVDLDQVDVVVTMGCGDACPVIPGKRYVDWELADPATMDLDQVRELRDQIDDKVHALLKELASEPEQPLEPIFSFQAHIRPLFRDKDIAEMKAVSNLDLAAYPDVRDNADAIFQQVATGWMPCDIRWSDEQVATFKQWIDDGLAP